jgi:hypothetical protein
VGKVLVVWGLVVAVVLAVLGLWAITGETGCHPAPAPVSEGAVDPEVALPAESEVWPIEAEPGMVLTY